MHVYVIGFNFCVFFLVFEFFEYLIFKKQKSRHKEKPLCLLSFYLVALLLVRHFAGLIKVIVIVLKELSLITI